MKQTLLASVLHLHERVKEERGRAAKLGSAIKREKGARPNNKTLESLPQKDYFNSLFVFV
jgi:hypothetical protein